MLISFCPSVGLFASPRVQLANYFYTIHTASIFSFSVPYGEAQSGVNWIGDLTFTLRPQSDSGQEVVEVVL